METRDRGEPMDEDTDEGDQRAERHESQSSHPASTPSVAAAPASDESPAAAGEGGAPANAAAANLNKRRRGLGVVTPTACTECRKKRAKVYAPYSFSILSLAHLELVYPPLLAPHAAQSPADSILFPPSSATVGNHAADAKFRKKSNACTSSLSDSPRRTCARRSRF
jgi:hypothetical protein